jgi:hypothetical protein
MSATQSAGELVRAGSVPLQVAVIAPPIATVSPSGLGGLDQVRWLAEGLAGRGHLVTLIGRDLGGLAGAGYGVIDTDPAGGECADPELVERWHAEQAGKALEVLGGLDVVSDHTRTGWLPAGGVSGQLRTVRTSYQPLPVTAGRLGWVAVSRHQQHQAAAAQCAGVIHPAIPVGEHLLSFDHAGPCVYLGPLAGRDGAGLALAAAHEAGRPIVLAGTVPSGEAAAYAEVELAPRLGREDGLLAGLSVLERWDLLAQASCLVAPLHPEVPYSLEVVEAMAYGTPVVTVAGTVGAELVSHGVSGLVAGDQSLLARAIVGAGRLEPRRVRDWAASQFNLPGMVSAYEWLFTQLVATGGP